MASRVAGRVGGRGGVAAAGRGGAKYAWRRELALELAARRATGDRPRRRGRRPRSSGGRRRREKLRMRPSRIVRGDGSRARRRPGAADIPRDRGAADGTWTFRGSRRRRSSHVSSRAGARRRGTVSWIVAVTARAGRRRGERSPPNTARRAPVRGRAPACAAVGAGGAGAARRVRARRPSGRSCPSVLILLADRTRHANAAKISSKRCLNQEVRGYVKRRDSRAHRNRRRARAASCARAAASTHRRARSRIVDDLEPVLVARPAGPRSLSPKRTVIQHLMVSFIVARPGPGTPWARRGPATRLRLRAWRPCGRGRLGSFHPSRRL